MNLFGLSPSHVSTESNLQMFVFTWKSKSHSEVYETLRVRSVWIQPKIFLSTSKK